MRLIETLGDIADGFDAIVLDQWGVLHDGTTPYAGAIQALEALKARGTRLAVLSNSGKRADINAARIADKGFAPDLFETVMTSGEALWRDVASGAISGTRVFAVTATPSDAHTWADGLNLTFVDTAAQADWVLIMGLSEFGGDVGKALAFVDAAKADILVANRPVYCSNPDRTSPRAGGVLVISPGALAHDIADGGGNVTFYGKPHTPVYRAVETALGAAPKRLLIVGDSLEHDIAGGATAGWQTCFIRGGIHAAAFGADVMDDLSALVDAKAAAAPDFSLPILR